MNDWKKIDETAFPQHDLSGYGMGPKEGPDGRYQMDGMTLRDWFAGQALAAIIAKHAAMGHQGAPGHGFVALDRDVASKVQSAIARGAYDYADAMLEARK